MNVLARGLASIVAAFALWGCTTTTHTEVEPYRPFDAYGPLPKESRQLGAGSYRALDLGNHWVVYATGVEPSTSWRHELVREGERDGAPVVALYAQEPTLAGAAMTPFIVSQVLPPRGRKVVLVRDREGTQEVAVEAPAQSKSSSF